MSDTPKQSKRPINDSSDSEIRLSLHQAERYFRTTRDTIRRNMDRLEIRPDQSGRFSIFDIHRCIAGDLKFERTRRERAEADKAEVEALSARQEVIHRNDVREFITRTFSPVREDVISMPSLLAAKCNPDNPELARGVLTEWSDTFIARRRENLPDIKTTDP